MGRLVAGYRAAYTSNEASVHAYKGRDELWGRHCQWEAACLANRKYGFNSRRFHQNLSEIWVRGPAPYAGVVQRFRTPGEPFYGGVSRVV